MQEDNKIKGKYEEKIQIYYYLYFRFIINK